jgi:hypothetical protein
MFIKHPPLEGKKEADIISLDPKARRKLYREEPIFIFDPQIYGYVRLWGDFTCKKLVVNKSFWIYSYRQR